MKKGPKILQTQFASIDQLQQKLKKKRQLKDLHQMAPINGTDNLFLSISLQIAVVGGYIEKAKHRENYKHSPAQVTWKVELYWEGHV